MEEEFTDEELLELNMYVSLGNDEISEAGGALCDLYDFSRSELSDEFRAALVEELKSFLKMYKEQTIIVEKEETYIQKTKYLEWKD